MSRRPQRGEILWIGGLSLDSSLGRRVNQYAHQHALWLTVAREAEGAERVREAAHDALDAVLLGPELKRPLALARQVHRTAPLTQILFLADSQQAERLRREMRIAPMIGTYWTIAELQDEQPVQALDESVRATRQRRQLQRTISRINTRLSTRLEIDTEDYDRLVISDRFLASVLDHAQDAIFSIQTGGRILTWNRAAAALFGLSESEAIGEPIDRILPDEHAAAVQNLLQSARLGQGAGRREFLSRRDSGEPLAVEMTFAPVLDEQGDAAAVSVIARDVTERRQHEEELRRLNAELEQRVAERTAVAERRAAQLRRLAAELTQAEQRERRRLSVLLHDQLQQILVAARMALDVGRKRVLNPDVDKTLRNVDSLILESIATSRSLSVELSPPVLHDAGLAAGLRWLSRWMQEKYGLAVEVAAEESAEPFDESMRLTLFEAVRELLFNVVKHAGVDAARVEVRQAGEEAVRIVVSDRGRGFDPEAVAEHDAPESGIGLFSIRERLELLGANVDIQSTPGEGTRIALTAPLRRIAGGPDSAVPSEGESEAANAPSAEPARERIRVLLVDDHAILRQGLANILAEHADIEVVGEAADGAAAVKLAQEARPDVVVMDISMPRMNGIEATRRLVADAPHLRVIGLSFRQEEEIAQAMAGAGAADYLTKGGPVEDLLASIRNAVPQ